MQLKTVGESLSALDNINKILNNTSNVKGMGGIAVQTRELQNAVMGYSAEAVKMALVESNLNKEQIKAILIKKGLKDEELEKTTATIVNTIETNKNTVAQAGNTASTTSLGLAFKGLAVRIKEATIAAGKFLFTTPAGWATLAIGSIALVTGAFKKFVLVSEESQENLENSVSEFESVTDEIKSLEEQLKTCTDRIVELQKLADSGTISVADEKELELLKEENKELERKIALKQTEQIQSAKDVLDDAQKLSKKKVVSEYSVDGFFVDPVEELQSAMEKYDIYDSVTYNNHKDQALQQELLNNASARAYEMYDIIEGEIDAYETLIDAGQELKGEDASRYEQLKKIQDEYLLHNYTVNGTLESFKALNTEQQKSILYSKLIKEGLSDIQVNSVLGNISEEDYDDLWNKDFSFTPSEMTDYATVEEYGKAYAEAWLEGIKDVVSDKNANKTENLLPDISETVDNIETKVRPALDALADAYKDIFTEDGFTLDNVGIDMLSSVKDALDKINEIDGVNIASSSFENFASVLSDTASTEKETQQAFNALVSEIINATDSTNFSAESFDVLAQSLESLGVTNAREYLTEIKNIQDKLISQGYSLENMTAEQAVEFLNEAEASDIATLYLKNYVFEKELANNPLNTSEDIQQLENLCNTLSVTGEMLYYVNKLKQAHKNIELRQETGFGAPIEAMEAEIRLAEKGIQELVEKGKTFEFSFEFDGSANKNSSGSSSSKSTKSDTEKSFDGIEIKLSNMSDALSDLDSQVDNTYSTWTARNKALADSISKTEDAIALQGKAYDAYMKKANSVGLDPTLAKWIREGNMGIKTIKDEKTQKQIDEYQSWYEKAQNCLETQKELEASLNELNSKEFQNIQSEFEQNINALETQKQLIESTISLLSKPADYDALRKSQEDIISELKDEKIILETELNGYGFNKNSEEYKNLKAEIDSIAVQIMEAKQELLDIDNLEFDNLKQSFENILSNLDSEYARLENDLTLLSESSDYDNLRKEKEKQISLLEQEKALLTEVFNASNFEKGTEEWHDMHSAITSVNEKLEETKDELVDISSIQFDNVSNFFDSQTSFMSGAIDLVQSKVDQLTAQGFYANEDYYNEMIGYSEDALSSLKSKYEQLYKIRENSGYAVGTDEWNGMTQDLIDVQKEITDTENQIIEFNNTVRDLNWEIFDYLQNAVSRLGGEMDYLIGLMENEDLFDDNGNRTKYGDATLALHAASYDVYKQQAQDYKDEMLELQEQLANGNMDVLDRYHELEDAHRDAVNSANDEKMAILDLVENSYQARLDAMNEIIDKNNELKNSQKDLYDYEKNVADQVKNISSLEKQLIAYQGDDSEEAKNKVQQIQMELEDARQALEETEMDRNIQEREQLLQNLTLEYETWMNQRLDNEDALLQEIIGGISTEGDEINETLKEVAESNGTLISESITSIFDAESPFTSGLTGISDGVAGTTTAINNLIAKVEGIVSPIDSINSLTDVVKGIADVLDAPKYGKEDNSNLKDTPSAPSADVPVSKPSQPTVNTTPSVNTLPSINKVPSANTVPTQKPQTGTGTANSWESALVSSKYLGNKSKLNTKTSIVDLLKSHDKSAEFNDRAALYKAMGGSGAYRGSAKQNRFMIDTMKAKGYKKGSSNIPFDQMNWVHNGELVLKRESDGGYLAGLTAGSQVFTEEQVRNLWKLTKMNPVLPNVTMPSVPVMQPRETINQSIGDVHVTCEFPNVKNYEEFMRRAQRDSRFEGMIQHITFDKNPMGKYKIKWD